MQKSWKMEGVWVWPLVQTRQISVNWLLQGGMCDVRHEANKTNGGDVWDSVFAYSLQSFTLSMYANGFNSLQPHCPHQTAIHKGAQ